MVGGSLHCLLQSGDLQRGATLRLRFRKAAVLQRFTAGVWRMVSFWSQMAAFLSGFAAGVRRMVGRSIDSQQEGGRLSVGGRGKFVLSYDSQKDLADEDSDGCGVWQ